MSSITFILLIFAAIVLFIIANTIWQAIKLKETIKKNWGTPPRQLNFDNEESLIEAWKIQRTLHAYDSEVDELTWNDLDMSSIFELINATYSSVGSEKLYQELRSFDFQKDQELETLIAFYQEHPAVREKIQYAFAGLGKQDHNFAQFYLAKGKKEKIAHLWFYIFLGIMPLVGILLLLSGQWWGVMVIIASFTVNTIIYLRQKIKLETELNSMRYLVQTVSLANKLAKIKHPLQQKIIEKRRSLKVIAKFGFSFRVKSNTEADLLADYLNLTFMIPFIAYNFVLARIRQYHREALDLWAMIGKLEVACAVLNFRTFMPDTCQPTFTEGGVTGENIYHPLLDQPVANPVHWTKSTLVTGSNASGKSTYVKSIAVSCLLAQTINTAVADSFTLQWGHVLTSMAVADDLTRGDSYFIAEIKSLKRLLDQAGSGERCYCFIDEILKGTNTIERIAASASVVEWLSQTHSLSFIATHDIELTEILKKYCANVHFGEEVTAEKGVTFDYEVKDGPARTRNAIALLKVLHYPAAIVKNAEVEAESFDHTRKWPVFH